MNNTITFIEGVDDVCDDVDIEVNTVDNTINTNTKTTCFGCSDKISVKCSKCYLKFCLDCSKYLSETIKECPGCK